MIIDGLEDIRHIAAPDHQAAEESKAGGMESMRIMDDGSTVQLIRARQVLSANELEELQALS